MATQTRSNSGRRNTLEQTFGLQQPWAQEVVRVLLAKLGQADDAPLDPVAQGFARWRTWAGLCVDFSALPKNLQPLNRWARSWNLTLSSPPNAAKLLFALQTYFALVVKWMTWHAVFRRLNCQGGDRVEVAERSPDFSTHEAFESLENGQEYCELGIANWPREDLFSWYLAAWDQSLQEALERLAQQVRKFWSGRPISVPGTDYFKNLYHALVPSPLRHSLGEFYTPGWLAQWVLQQAAPEFFGTDETDQQDEDLLHTRVLDPACGSGTFLVKVLAQLLRVGKRVGVSPARLLQTAAQSVVGWDVNPLAVLAARANWVLNLLELFPGDGGKVEVPIFWTDPVQLVTVHKELRESRFGTLSTPWGPCRVPPMLLHPETLAHHCLVAQKHLAQHHHAAQFAQACRAWQGSPAAPPSELQALQTWYEDLQQLREQGAGGLVPEMIREFLVPLTQGQFDLVVGNPPWVNWEHVNGEYRNTLRKLRAHYLLNYRPSGRPPRLGAVKGDFSALMIYAVADRWLKHGGKLAFVVPQSLFKAAGAGAGFRRFRIAQTLEEEVPLQVVRVDDLIRLRPFAGAANRTAVLVLEKGTPTQYPVPYTLWHKPARVQVNHQENLQEVESSTHREQWWAQPADPHDPTSAWITAPAAALRGLQKLLGCGPYRAHAGVCTWLNGAYWVEVESRQGNLWRVRNLTQGTKVSVPSTTTVVEADCLFPLIRGKDVRRWNSRHSAWILIPYDPQNPQRAYPPEELQTRWPKTFAYLKHLEKWLAARSGYRQLLARRREPFYALMDLGPYSFAPWKVLWREQARGMVACVVGPQEGKPVLPDHKLMLIPCSGPLEAHFLCACLNSTPCQAVVLSYAVNVQMGPHVLERLRMPKFNPRFPVHLHLATCSKLAHLHASYGLDPSEMHEEVDRYAAHVWNLTPKELEQLQELVNLEVFASRH